MSTPEQPDGPRLTRKQLREIRMTGATPVITDDAASDEPAEPDAESQTAEPVEAAAPEAPEAPAPVEPPAPAVPLPRAAAPVVAPPPPTPDAQVDLGVSPLTRRQAREQERIRTASVPVITPDVAGASATSEWAPPPVPAAPAQDAELPAPSFVAEPPADDVAEPPADDVAEQTDESSTEPDEEIVELVDVPLLAEEGPDVETTTETDAAGDRLEIEAEPAAASAAEQVSAPEEERPVLRPEFGSTLLAAGAASETLPPSFDDLITRGGSNTGSLATPNALIISHSPTAGPLTSPVTATGEVLITGTFNLPEGLGSQGHAHGTADGKETDSVLIDGELPPSSSPTPIAASAAISTVKGTGEIIRPPAPEKGNKLMLGLAITAGVLAVALVGVLILAFVTGVF